MRIDLSFIQYINKQSQRMRHFHLPTSIFPNVPYSFSTKMPPRRTAARTAASRANESPGDEAEIGDATQHRPMVFNAASQNGVTVHINVPTDTTPRKTAMAADLMKHVTKTLDDSTAEEAHSGTGRDEPVPAPIALDVLASHEHPDERPLMFNMTAAQMSAKVVKSSLQLNKELREAVATVLLKEKVTGEQEALLCGSMLKLFSLENEKDNRDGYNRERHNRGARKRPREDLHAPSSSSFTKY